MTLYEKQCWCADCRRNHVIKLYSRGELNRQEETRFFADAEYADLLMRHTVCRNCGSNITPHVDIDIVALNGEWSEVCIECLRNGLDR